MDLPDTSLCQLERNRGLWPGTKEPILLLTTSLLQKKKKKKHTMFVPLYVCKSSSENFPSSGRESRYLPTCTFISICSCLPLSFSSCLSSLVSFSLAFCKAQSFALLAVSTDGGCSRAVFITTQEKAASLLLPAEHAARTTFYEQNQRRHQSRLLWF